MQTMSPLDASFLHIEDAVTHMHIGSVGLFEGPAPGPGEVKAAVARDLPLVPRYRQKVRFVPLALGRPTWVDDRHFNLDYHVRRTALPAPGGHTELRNLVGRVMSQQLDRNKPLWELWVAEGLDNGGWAVISKVHHCMVDGVSATDLMSVLLDSERDATHASGTDDWEPEPEPSSAHLVAHALRLRAADPYEITRTAVAAVRGPRRVARQAVDAARGFANMRNLLTPNSYGTLNGPIGPHRTWEWARARLSDVKAIRARHGGTINDVVLAVITNGFRELLESRGESLNGHVIRTLVPVSVRTESDRGVPSNKVSAMFAELPVHIDDPGLRVEALHHQMQDLKHSGQAVAAERLTAMGGFAPGHAARARWPGRDPAAAEQRQHGHDERPGAAEAALPGRSPDAGGVPVRPARWACAHRGRDLFLRRRHQLRRDGRPRHRRGTSTCCAGGSSMASRSCSATRRRRRRA